MTQTKRRGSAMSESPQRVLIAGYYGFGNAGDEAILDSIRAMLRRQWPATRLTVVSGNPDETKRTQNCEAVLWTDIPAITAAVRSSDLVILGGGGLFHDYWGVDPAALGTANHSGIVYYASVAAIAALLGKPLATWSVGVGPLLTTDGKRLTADVFNAAQFIAVRDESSAALVRQIGVTAPVEIVADPGFAFDFTPAPRSPEGRVRLCVALRNWNIGVQPARWEREIATAIDAFVAKHDAEALFVPFQTIAGELEDDRAVARRVMAQMQNRDRCRLSEATDARAVAADIASADLVLGMRYHALIFAATAGIPFVAVEYDPKVGSWVNEAKVGELVVDVASFRGSELTGKLTVALDRREEIGPRLRKLAAEKRTSAERFVSLLSDVDSKPRPADFLRAAADALARHVVDRPAGTGAADLRDQVAALELALRSERERAEAALSDIRARETTIAAQEADVRHLRSAVEKLERVAGRLALPDSRLKVDEFDVVCFSIIDWEFRWQRPQQIMSELANRGHRVFYVSISRFLPLGAERIRTVELRENVWEVQLSVPQDFSVYGGEIPPDLRLQLHDDLAALRNELGIRRAISVVQVATWAPAALDARDSFGWPVVYDCMDEWDTFPGMRAAVLSAERKLVAECDLLVVTSDKLEKKWRPRASNIVLARNATRFAHFENAAPRKELAGLKHPVVGYFGAIADWFDLDLMTRIAKERPDYSFVLVGGIFDLPVEELAALPNVRLEGQQPYAEIPSYLASFDVCIIPFKVNEVTEATDPVKFYEYISQGKPVVSTPMRELEFYRDYLYLATDGDDFLRKLDAAVVEKDPTLRARRIELARENDWSARADAIEGGVRRAFTGVAQRELFTRVAKYRGDGKTIEVPFDIALALVEEAVASQQEAEGLAGRTLELSRQLTARTEELRQRERDAADQVALRDRTIRELQRELFDKVGERDRIIGTLQESSASRERLLTELQSRMATVEAEREQLGTQLHQTSNDFAGADKERKELHGIVGELSEKLRRTTIDYQHMEQTAMSLRQELHGIHFSKFWKAASLYWRVVEKVQKLRGKRKELSAPPAAPADTPASTNAVVASPVAAPPGETPVVRAAIAQSNRHDVVCFPIIDWSFRFQRPQQLMSQFAARGHRVFYIAQKFRQNGPHYKLERVAENVYEVSLRGPSKSVYTDRLTEREADSLFEALDALRRDELLAATVSIVQLPFWTPIAERARRKLAWPLVYDCMDHHAGFTTNTEEMLNEEARLLRESDLVVVSSLFLEKEAKEHNDHVVLVRNACDYDHFATISEVRNERPVIGYYGAIADWFDSNLVADLAARRPDWDFILVGSTFTADVSRLKKLKNVIMPGEKPYAEIPRWLEKFDVAIVPFKRLPLTEATNPVKAYEMLAGGKPVVSVPIPEVAPLAPLVQLASTAEEFEREILAAMKNNSREKVEERRRFAAENTWARRYETLEPAVASVFPKASIVVVTYNNVDLNKLCIESLYEKHEWPNFELFVVDNASSDSTPDYLREAEKQYPHLTVILNDDNKGFAAANNQALRVATGDFLVLLNNDTVSPRGWFAALARHLTADRTIGLIGPSTNAIGNEGMVDVGYKEISEMPSWAAEFMRRNDGKSFEIPMLAMFCVAMRRDVFETVGLLDENFGIGMYEDDDYAHRMRLAEYRVVCARDSFVHHWMKAAFGKIPTEEYKRLFEKNKAYYESKWATRWVPHQRA